MGMYEEIVRDITTRVSRMPDARAATQDEVTICWLITEVERIKKVCQENNIDPNPSLGPLGPIKFKTIK